jgi:hypothetical protein
MYEQSKTTGCNIEIFMIVIDADVWGLQLAMIHTDSDHYPKRMGSLFVINDQA